MFTPPRSYNACSTPHSHRGYSKAAAGLTEAARSSE